MNLEKSRINKFDWFSSNVVGLITGAVNGTVVSAYNPILAKYVVYTGVAISNYLVNKVATLEMATPGTGMTHLSTYLTNATNDFANSDMNIALII